MEMPGGIHAKMNNNQEQRSTDIPPELKKQLRQRMFGLEITCDSMTALADFASSRQKSLQDAS